MRESILIVSIMSLCLFCSSCTQSTPTQVQNNDPELVGKWVRNNRYNIEFYSNGIGAKGKDVSVTEDIKKHKRTRINWATFNNNFLLLNTDERVMGFSYQIIGDTLFIRQPEDNLEYFIRVKE